MTTRVRMIVTGRVQGVGYRVSCARAAKQVGVVGSVRNLADGSVEVVAEGDEEAVASMTEWCRVGPRFSEVRSVEVVTEVPTGEPTFRIVG